MSFQKKCKEEETEKIENECKELLAQINEYKRILADKNEIYKVIKSECIKLGILTLNVVYYILKLDIIYL